MHLQHNYCWSRMHSFIVSSAWFTHKVELQIECTGTNMGNKFKNCFDNSLSFLANYKQTTTWNILLFVVDSSFFWYSTAKNKQLSQAQQLDLTCSDKKISPTCHKIHGATVYLPPWMVDFYSQFSRYIYQSHGSVMRHEKRLKISNIIQ